jgi:DNA-binding FadR family transcriptional regulator
MFIAVKPSRIFQDVVDQIQDAILQGELAPGEKLPPERELKEMFSISRGTLREALRVLEEKGLIDIQLGVGGGAIVQAVTPEVMVDGLSLMIRGLRIPLAHLQEFRTDIESKIAQLAAERATPANIDELREILKEAKDALDQQPGWEAYVAADAKFHMTLARISGNAVYEYIQTGIHENINRYYAEYLEHEESVLREHYKDLRAITDAVATGDAEQACAVMQLHLSRLGQKNIQSLED